MRCTLPKTLLYADWLTSYPNPKDMWRACHVSVGRRRVGGGERPGDHVVLVQELFRMNDQSGKGQRSCRTRCARSSAQSEVILQMSWLPRRRDGLRTGPTADP
jgi:hypothetical protein